jgi:hypothetical protein
MTRLAASSKRSISARGRRGHDYASPAGQGHALPRGRAMPALPHRRRNRAHHAPLKQGAARIRYIRQASTRPCEPDPTGSRSSGASIRPPRAPRRPRTTRRRRAGIGPSCGRRYAMAVGRRRKDGNPQGLERGSTGITASTATATATAPGRTSAPTSSRPTRRARRYNDPQRSFGTLGYWIREYLADAKAKRLPAGRKLASAPSADYEESGRLRRRRRRYGTMYPQTSRRATAAR